MAQPAAWPPNRPSMSSERKGRGFHRQLSLSLSVSPHHRARGDSPPSDASRCCPCTRVGTTVGCRRDGVEAQPNSPAPPSPSLLFLLPVHCHSAGYPPSSAPRWRAGHPDRRCSLEARTDRHPLASSVSFSSPATEVSALHRVAWGHRRRTGVPAPGSHSFSSSFLSSLFSLCGRRPSLLPVDQDAGVLAGLAARSTAKAEPPQSPVPRPDLLCSHLLPPLLRFPHRPPSLSLGGWTL